MTKTRTYVFFGLTMWFMETKLKNQKFNNQTVLRSKNVLLNLLPTKTDKMKNNAIEASFAIAASSRTCSALQMLQRPNNTKTTWQKLTATATKK